jgi:hypothetical protein
MTPEKNTMLVVRFKHGDSVNYLAYYFRIPLNEVEKIIRMALKDFV